MSKRTFRPTSRGNYYARVDQVGLTVFRSKVGEWQWRIRSPGTEPRVSERKFTSANAALDDLLVVVAVVHKATAKDPHDRYETAGAFADDLERVLAGRRVTARLCPLERTAGSTSVWRKRI